MEKLILLLFNVQTLPSPLRIKLYTTLSLVDLRLEMSQGSSL